MKAWLRLESNRFYVVAYVLFFLTGIIVQALTR